jgi:hypothetical protein
MNLACEYMHHRSGYRFGTRCYWVRIYEGALCDAPVVVCSPLTEIGVTDDTPETSGYLAAEVIREWFAGRLPDLPRPLLWIEHRPRRRQPERGRYYLLAFATYRPKLEGLGFAKRVTLGAPKREQLTPEEVAVLTGDGARPSS